MDLTIVLQDAAPGDKIHSHWFGPNTKKHYWRILSSGYLVNECGSSVVLEAEFARWDFWIERKKKNTWEHTVNGKRIKITVEEL